MKVERTIWNDESLTAELMLITKSIGRMPTASELRNLGRNDIACQISRRGGFIAWAEKLNVERSDSDSDKGWRGEKIVMDLLKANLFHVERSDAVKASFDLLIDGVVRVDVKTASMATYGKTSGWYFRLGKVAQADIVALFREDEGDIFLLPWKVCSTSNITLGLHCDTHGKFARFRNRFDLLRSMVDDRAIELSQWISE